MKKCAEHGDENNTPQLPVIGGGHAAYVVVASKLAAENGGEVRRTGPMRRGGVFAAGTSVRR